MSPLLTVLILRNTQVHISTTYHGNETPYIKALINDSFALGTILSIPYIDPYDGYNRFWWDFDDSRPGGKDNIIEDVVILENLLDVLR